MDSRDSRMSARWLRAAVIGCLASASLPVLLVTHAQASAPPTITAVGSLADAQGNGVGTLSVSPHNVGDALVLTAKISSATATVTSVSGGGVTSWTKMTSFEDNASHDLEIWVGTVTTAGSSHVSVSYSASVSADSIELTSQEFTAGLGTSSVWTKDKAAGQNNGSSTTVASPALTPSDTGELYVGYSRSPGQVLAGTTSGFTYDSTVLGNIFLYDPAVSSAAAPTSTQSPANTSAAVGALITVSSSATSSPTPTVTAVSPGAGPAAGGTVVTITGANFASGDTVAFGGAAASAVVVVSATSITATSPTGAGTVDVTVMGPGGTSATSTADQFSYQASVVVPTVTAVSLSAGPAAGGTVVTITGTNFVSADTVAFGTTAASAVAVVSATSITATSPTGTGTVDVTVTGPGGTSATSTADRFTYAVTTNSTITAVGSLADAQGNGVGTLSVSPHNVGDALVLTAKISSATATVTSVSGGGVTSWTKMTSFEDNASHDLEIWVGTVTTAGSSHVSVSYSASVSADSIELTSQEFTAGLGTSSVWTKDKAAGQNNGSSTTVASPALTPSDTGELYVGYSRSPGQVLAGTTSGFTYDSTVLGNIFLYDPAVSSAAAPTSTQSPANTSAAVGALITVSSSATSSPTPTVTAVSPGAGPAAGGTVVTITGANFASGDTVAFGGAAASAVVVVSATSITATSPTGAGTVDVTVMGPGGTSATSTADQFSYSGTAPTQPHVMVIMMENETAGSIIGNPSLPYINGTLVAHYPIIENNYAVAHPSLPNYLELLSGSTWGVTSDCAPDPGCEGQSNFANQLDQAGIPWAGYMESMPSAGYTGGDTGGDDGYGDQLYAQHHNPFVYFPDLANDLTTHVKPLTSMISDLNSADPPDFVWVTPNMLDDMHDGPTTTGDTWLSQQIPAIQATQWYQDGGQIILTYDEGDDSDTSGIGGGAGGQIPGIVISQALYDSASDPTPVDQAGILGSIEDLFGVPALNDATNPAHGSLLTELTGGLGPAPPPTITGVAPDAGPAAGGTTVTVTGTNFVSGDEVSFGQDDATQVSVASATSITATSPPGSGTIDVTVSGPGGTSATDPADQFAYAEDSGPPAISAVGSLADTEGTGVSSLSVSPEAVGDALVLTLKVSSATATATSVSGGGVTTWTKVTSFADNASHDLEIWLGTVTSAGSSQISVSYSSSVSSDSVELTAQEFTAGLGSATSWLVDQAGGQNNASSTTVASPPLTPTGTGELYVGYSRSPGQVLAGTTSGFTYDPTALGNMFLYDPDVSGAVAPTSAQSPADTSSTVGTLITVS